jgi:hypothetical protein
VDYKACPLRLRALVVNVPVEAVTGPVDDLYHITARKSIRFRVLLVNAEPEKHLQELQNGRDDSRA